MSFSNLPAELIHLIVESIQEERYLNCLARTCWSLHLLVNPILYQTTIRSSHGFPLIWAAKHGSEVTAYRAFEFGASTNSCHYSLRQSLVAAVDERHETITRQILEQIKDPSIFAVKQSCMHCEDPNFEDISKYMDPISLAAERRNLNIVRLLLTYGVAPNPSDPNSALLVLSAARNGDLSLVQSFIEAGYPLDHIRDSSIYETSLNVASRQGHTNVVRYLLDMGANLVFTGGHLTPLGSAAEIGHIETVKLLLERGADPDEDPWGLTALSHAAKNGDVEIVELLLDYEADLDSDMCNGRGIFYNVARKGQLQILKLLLARGAPFYPKIAEKQAALLTSIITNGWRLLQRHKQAALADFFRTFVDMDDMITHGDNAVQAVALYLAVGYGWNDLVQRILERGCSADAIREYPYQGYYRRPILLAIEMGHFEATKLLAEHGADLQQKKKHRVRRRARFARQLERTIYRLQSF